MEEYIIIGISNGKVADHASSIDTIVRTCKDGTTQESKYHPNSSNPGTRF